MNLKELLLGIFVFIRVSAVLSVAAHEAKYAAPLLGSSEIPPNASPSTGTVYLSQLTLIW
jgi:hypothetical protein